ncbi:PLASTID MOVEMENT IMPAIRED protein (DUF827) [Tasmannia lanceolata]|uniref:PLASTID MOVEMENT IMPAIRED protein (DUF827) n=1 Tax=Tasmannia lanceolata TaxID=3420 RepID=UPI004063138D
MAGMHGAEAENRERSRSVETAVNLYGERILGGKAEKNKTPMAFVEKSPSRARELHIARRDMDKFNDRKKYAETIRDQAESELSNAKKAVKDLTLRIEESNTKLKSQKHGIQGLKKQKGPKELNNDQYMEVMRELEAVKQELNNLKLDMAAVLQAKVQAEKQTESLNSRARSCSSSLEALTKEIEETNEEEVLVELAKIEAVRELGAIESQREAQAAEFSSTMEKTKKRINNLIQEANHSKELEAKLEITSSDVNVLQNELKLIKARDGNNENNQLNNMAEEISKRREEESEVYSLLQSAKAELNEAKNELISIREEGFQFMASMDIIREELQHISEETARLKKIEQKADSAVQNLNSKLLRAKSKLEAASKAEEKARPMLSNLSETLQQLQTEKEAANKERELISKETESIKLDIEKAESDIGLEGERLQAAMQELEAIKKSEAIALESLRSLSERTMKARASSSLHNSTITISNFEYEYLSRRGEGAEEIADKKVAAAQAWIEAFKCAEKEILMKTKIVSREISEIRKEEEEELHKAEKALVAINVVEDELNKRRNKHEKQLEDVNLQIEAAFPMTPRHTKIRRPASPGARRVIRSSSVNLRKKRKVVPNLVKFFSSKGNGK